MSWWTNFDGNERGLSASTKPQPRNPVPSLEILEDRFLMAAGLDSNLAYVQGLYQSYLGRSGSMSELESWQTILVNKGMSSVVSSIAHSAEAYHTTIVQYYRQFLGRDPQSSEEAGLVGMLKSGTHPDVVAATFLGSPEFYQRAPQIVGTPNAAATDSTYVRAMFKILLNRTPSSSELNNFTQNILLKNTRPGTALFILTSPEYRGLAVQTYYGSDPRQGILDRPTNPINSEVQHWVQSGYRLDEIRDIFHASVEAFHVTRVDHDVNQIYVNGLYQDVLGRSGTQDELHYWEDQLVQSGMRNTTDAIASSHEAATNMVQTWYVHYLQRTPVGGEEQPLVSQIEKGTAPEAVLAGILGSAEYFTLVTSNSGPAPGKPEDFVRAIYQQLLNRSPSADELQDFTKNQIPARGRQGVALIALNSPEYRTLVVQSYYNDLLHRHGAVTSAEVQGWVVSRKNLGQIREEFLVSPERYALAMPQGQTGTVDAPGTAS